MGGPFYCCFCIYLFLFLSFSLSLFLSFSLSLFLSFSLSLSVVLRALTVALGRPLVRSTSSFTFKDYHLDPTRYKNYNDSYVYGPSMSPEFLLSLCKPPNAITVPELICDQTNKHVRINGRHVLDLTLPKCQGQTVLRAKDVIGPQHTLLFPGCPPKDIIESASHLLSADSIMVIKHSSPVRSLESLSEDCMMNTSAVMSVAHYLIDLGLCMGVW